MPTSTTRRDSPDGVRVVAMGGGTGLSTLLRGLKRHVPPVGSEASAREPLVSDLAAIVTVSDDGGSSGQLRKDFNMLPPGDIRNCMVALSEDEHLLSLLFQYRFDTGEGLKGHSFGNLFLAALTDVTGDFALAVKMSSQILATRGHIYPATNANVTLRAQMDNGEDVRGETNITASNHRIVRLRLEPEVAEPLPETLDAIHHADLITLGPGSLYTSLIPNLLVQGIPEAITESNAICVYICNLMTQRNESLGLTASEHIARIYEHAGREIFDFAMINTAPISWAVAERYAREQAQPIVADVDEVEKLGVAVIRGAFAHEGQVLRHDYDRVADVLLSLVDRRNSAADLAAMREQT